MWALLSDIHSNYEAFLAVIDDIHAQRDVTRIICVGDVVGYGPNPCECIDLAMNCDVVLVGNHDQLVLLDSGGFNDAAKFSSHWTRAQLKMANDPDAETRWEFLRGLPRVHTEGDHLFVHGSARNPLNEYVFPEDVFNQQKMEKIFQLVDKHCFMGHTHFPGVFTESLNFYSPADVEYKYKFDGAKTLVNVGSVGQPRDGDPRACYVLLDNDAVEFRRIDYDIDTTSRKIYEI